jgi:hypothetical protein
VAAVGDPAGEFLPPVATKLTQSPWFLKTWKSRQPPFLQPCFDAGSTRRVNDRSSKTKPGAPVGPVALACVLYAHALARRRASRSGGALRAGACCATPGLGWPASSSLRRVLPNRYPLALDVERYVADEQRLGRMLDYAVIVPRLQRLYEWSAQELREPRVLELVRDGNPIYAWPFEQRHVWRTPKMPFAGRVLERVTRAR